MNAAYGNPDIWRLNLQGNINKWKMGIATFQFPFTGRPTGSVPGHHFFPDRGLGCIRYPCRSRKLSNEPFTLIFLSLEFFSYAGRSRILGVEGLRFTIVSIHSVRGNVWKLVDDLALKEQHPLIFPSWLAECLHA